MSISIHTCSPPWLVIPANVLSACLPFQVRFGGWMELILCILPLPGSCLRFYLNTRAQHALPARLPHIAAYELSPTCHHHHPLLPCLLRDGGQDLNVSFCLSALPCAPLICPTTSSRCLLRAFITLPFTATCLLILLPVVRRCVWTGPLHLPSPSLSFSPHPISPIGSVYHAFFFYTMAILNYMPHYPTQTPYLCPILFYAPDVCKQACCTTFFHSYAAFP